jgi:hypothetical protein
MDRDPLWASREGASVVESCAAHPGTKVPLGRERVPVLPRGSLGDQPQLSRPRDGPASACSARSSMTLPVRRWVAAAACGRCSSASASAARSDFADGVIG